MDTYYSRPYRLAIHSPHIIPRGNEKDTLGIDINQNMEIIYEKITTKLLPAPYSTNCINYVDIGYQSQTDCIDKCKVAKTKAKCNRW